MSFGSHYKFVKRILVALDASPQSLAALRVATDLAARLDAELIGIFIEDINLVQLARLPFTRQISIATGTLLQMDSSLVERELRSQARWALNNMALLADKLKFKWSFRVVRGAISPQLQAAAAEADITILGKTGWSGRRLLGSTAQNLVNKAPCTSLILQNPIHFGAPVIVLYDGTQTGKRALESVDLIISPETQLIVVLLAGDAEEARQFRREVDTFFSRQGLQPQYHWFRHINSAVLTDLVKTELCGVLVLPTKSERIPKKIILDTLNQSECAVLLVN
ncbi:MAG: universal stress protein [Anaerolineales bacterium]|nr:universal stress protein [Anaerolineales bacterium]